MVEICFPGVGSVAVWLHPVFSGSAAAGDWSHGGGGYPTPIPNQNWERDLRSGPRRVSARMLRSVRMVTCGLVFQDRDIDCFSSAAGVGIERCGHVCWRRGFLIFGS